MSERRYIRGDVVPDDVREFVDAAAYDALEGLVRWLPSSIEFVSGGKCPVCVGWEVIKGQGECRGKHTKNCALAALLRWRQEHE